MTTLVLKIYDMMRRHRGLCLLSFIIVTLLLAVSVLQLRFKEDISDFLPLGGKEQHAMKVYQDISGASRVFALFQYRDTTKADPDLMVAAIDDFTTTLTARDTTGMVSGLMAQMDLEHIEELSSFVYAHMPYFLTADDYARMDSLLAQPDFIREQLQQDKQMLLLPVGGLMAESVGRDPLNLFAPVMRQLQQATGRQHFEQYDGYIFSPDMQRAVVMMNSPYGASETEHNAQLAALLDDVAREVEATHGEIEIHLTGGPLIAVGNAQQIKTDSMMSVILAVTLILALLFVTLRSWRNLLLIVVSIAWGWLFAMGCLALIHQEVSIIVIGISSVILGIAVNYPLHLTDHLSHAPDMKTTLREIVQPLVVGNITTVGAFLTLVPLKSAALRDLGLFSAFLLAGTILFVLLWLPQLAERRERSGNTLLTRLGNVRLEDKRWLVAAVVVLTFFFGYYSLRTTFDSDLSHINYMTEEQRADMNYFQQLAAGSEARRQVYVVSHDSTIDGALDENRRIQQQLQALQDAGTITAHAGCSRFLASQQEQQTRLERWHQWAATHRDALLSALHREAQTAGFANGAMADFETLLTSDFQPLDIAAFQPLTTTVFAANLSCDSLHHDYSVVETLTLGDQADDTLLTQELGHSYIFDISKVNSALATGLSDNFNYIGWACGCIVFFFLWFSFRSLKLAMLSFLPMAISWVWILGLMGLLDIQFNIVNVILATFIFGQGDDYTIFMTEGAVYEQKYGRQMLASYKHSIILSALIMFIGIGSLILARHPALHSLAEVTIVGMFSVVLMAFIFPPFILKMLKMKS